jgi:hypothetical protein
MPDQRDPDIERLRRAIEEPAPETAPTSFLQEARARRARMTKQERIAELAELDRIVLEQQTLDADPPMPHHNENVEFRAMLGRLKKPGSSGPGYKDARNRRYHTRRGLLRSVGDVALIVASAIGALLAIAFAGKLIGPIGEFFGSAPGSLGGVQGLIAIGFAMLTSLALLLAIAILVLYEARVVVRLFFHLILELRSKRIERMLAENATSWKRHSEGESTD